MVLRQNPKRIGRTDIADLNEDEVVVWQHKNYLKSVIFMALVFPTLVCGLGWGDWLGGYIYGGILRIFFVQQATFCVNSLAHWLGDQPFDDKNSPRDPRAHGPGHPRRGLPQLPPRVPVRLPQRHPVVAVRPHQVVHLGCGSSSGSPTT